MVNFHLSCDHDDLDPSDDEVELRKNLEVNLRNLSLDPARPHFLGKSSGLLFLQAALDAKDEYAGVSPGSVEIPLANARPEFWFQHPWTVLQDHPYPAELFPEPSLMSHLFDRYFANYNIYMPIFHRPTFEKQVKEGLHLIDDGFGATVLLACALGAKFTDDPRVLLEGTDSPLSAGWKWFRPVQMTRKSIRMQTPRLFDLQIACLATEFLHASSYPQASLSIVGEGIRTAQDLGAHRKKAYAAMPRVEAEMLKRAFWTLVTLDRAHSSALGRPCCIQDEDFDVDFPTECDDEYWFPEDPKLAFKQPPGKPCLISFFNSLIRLNQIHGCALRTIYATNKSQALLGFSGPDWEQHVVTELDSALNKWVDTVPSHLKWDPNIENITYFNQSVFLYTTYYFLQITIHRKFIPSPRGSKLAASLPMMPHLAICTNAARSCIHILDVQYQRSGSSTYQNMLGLFCSTVVLLLNIWTNRRAGTPAAPEHFAREMRSIHKAMIILKSLEARWHVAGRVLDVLSQIATAGDLVLPSDNEHLHLKRRREDVDNNGQPVTQPPQATQAAAPSPAFQTMNGQGNTRTPQPPTSFSSTRRVSPLSANKVALPMHSDELGRFPLHPAFEKRSVSPPSLTQNAQNGWASMSSGLTTMAAPTSSQPRQYMTNTHASASTSQRVEPVYASAYSTGFTPYQAVASPPNMVQYTNGSPVMVHQQAHTAAGLGTPPLDGVMSGMNSWTPFAESMDSPANDIMTMWSSAPNGMIWEDWGEYITGMGSMGLPTAEGPSDPQQQHF